MARVPESSRKAAKVQRRSVSLRLRGFARSIPSIYSISFSRRTMYENIESKLKEQQQKIADLRRYL